MASNGSFIGNASEWYIESSLEALSIGDEEIQSQDEFQSTLPLEEVFDKEETNQKVSNTKYKNSFQQKLDVLHHSNSSYTVSFVDEYAQLFGEKYIQLEEYMVNTSRYFVEQVQNLCKEKYIIPETTQKVEAFLKEIENFFPEMDLISNETHQTYNEFIQAIKERDH